MYCNDIARRLMDVPADQQRQMLFASAAARLTYGEAREGMLAYAGWLNAAEGIRPGERVAVCLPRTLETVQAIYGVLAAGAAYVPLQYLGPPARLHTILGSLRPNLLLTTGEMAARIRAADDGSVPTVRIVEVAGGDDRLAARRRGIAARRTLAEVAPSDLAGVFFTSGSTGEPKGVMWSQRGMAAALAALPRWRRQRADDRLICLAALHYSAACEIFYPTFSGSSLYLPDDREAMFADRLAAVLERERITIWSATATALRMLVEGGNLPGRNMPALRRVEIYGERMPMAALRAAMAAVPRAEFHNLYAASEAFDMIEYQIPRPLGPEVTALPLGRPSPIYQLSLREENGKEVATGEIGEICVAGPSVTTGYWNDPALSAAKRLAGVADSFRTGDLAVLGEDGLFHLVGRHDHVIKLRGHRFDLGEIEAAARLEPRVREAVACALGAGNEPAKVVLAVLAGGGNHTRTGLERELHRIFRERLPVFARPARIAMFDDFPLLASGKIDRRSVEKRMMRT